MNLVKRSLILSITVLLALLGLQAAQSVWQVHRLAGVTATVATGAATAQDARQIWAHFNAVETALQELTAFADTDSAASHRQTFEADAAKLRAAAQALAAQAQGDLRASAGTVAKAVDSWLALATPHVAREGSTELPSMHRLGAAREHIQADVTQLVSQAAAAAQTGVAASESAARQAYGLTAGLLALAVSLGGCLGWTALRGLHRQLGADASEVAQVTNAVAAGDLTRPLQTTGLPEGSVMAATARMQHALIDTVTTARAVGLQLAHGVDEIAAGNLDLSRVTEQQAAAIEKTSSTMAQLGAAVRQNADNATQASELAQQASRIAAEGGAVVGRSVETMKGINESSRRIADIIGVIDGIAFQTNILALNAAVEAARAGEQGRGFAVVASEVRSLAQRSAEAAREIKALINASVERVEHGSTLVDQAGRTMQEVVQSIARVASVMGEIRAAGAEQSDGVAEVGRAIQQLDQSTQQNAARAEQGAAAAERLRSQGQELTQAMAFFRTEVSQADLHALA
jgi:methyl-accepting chemotaxis protein